MSLKNHRILVGIAAVIALWLSYTPQIQSVEQGVLSLLYQFIPAKEFSSPVAVVSIDQIAGHTEDGGAGSYQTIAKLLDKLTSTSIKSIGLMLPLSDSQNYLEKISQDEFLHAFKPADNEQAKKLLQRLDYDDRLV